MSGMKHQNRFLKPVKIRKLIALLSDENVRFRTQQRVKYSSLQLTVNCIAAKRCLHSTLFQTDLRITDHRGHQFSRSLKLRPVQNSNRMASRLNATTGFPSVFFQLVQYSRQHPSSSAHRAALTTKCNLTYPALT